METLNLLKQLVEPVAVSGCENNIVERLKDILKPYGEVSVDNLNNVFCTFGEGYHFLLDAHIDEIGFIVKDITENGFLKVSNAGGVDRRMLPATEVSVWGDKEYFGVISTIPNELDKDESNKAPQIDDIVIDVGMTKEQVEGCISLGDRVTFKRQFTKLLGTQVSSNALDDRAGVASIILALDKLKKLNCKITVMLSSQEEVGTRGAKVGAFGRDIDEAIAVDVSFGYSPLCNKKDCGEIGKGAMIGISPILDRDMSKAMINVAENNNIPHQIEVMSGGHTGTNADVITLTDNGVKASLLSIPQKYMHSPIEVVDTKDIDSVADLIVAYISERVGELNA